MQNENYPQQPVSTPVQPSGHFRRNKYFKVLLKTIVVVIIVGGSFYTGYRFALYRMNTSGQSSGNCPSGWSYDYPPLPNATQKVCINPNVALKPVIYLYPTSTEKVGVKLYVANGFSRTIPSYSNQTGWQIEAQPNGTLTNLADGKTYPYLFWEGKPNRIMFDMTKGFAVPGKDTKNFLQKQLTSMGLNQNETSAFISFWLPQMEHNPYNLIHFAGSEYTNTAKLAITPQPNSLLRIFMAYKPLQNPVLVSPQSFPIFHRDGFTVVEWGGELIGNR